MRVSPAAGTRSAYVIMSIIVLPTTMMATCCAIPSLRSESHVRVPARADRPVLTSVLPVVEASKHVRTDEARLVDVAGWLAYEELPMPQFLLPFRPAGDRGDVIDFILLCASINFAFTDFTTRTKFEVEYAGQLWSDSDALFACVGRAMVAGDDLGNGRRLSTITAQQLDGIFAGNITMPMLEERATILRDIGTTLVDRYDGRFRN